MYIYYILELKIFFLGNHGGIERGISVRISHRWHPVNREGKEVFSRCRKKKGEREGRGKEIYRHPAHSVLHAFPQTWGKERQNIVMKETDKVQQDISWS